MFRIIKASDVCASEVRLLNLKSLPGNGGGPVPGSGNGGGPAAGSLEQGQKAREEAGEILALARAEAEKILEKAREEARALAARAKEEAFAEGLARGLEEGRERGYREGVEEAARESSRLREEALSVLRGAEEARRRLFCELEGEVVDLAVEIAEKVLLKELEQDREAVLAVAREALSLLAGRKSAYLFVHPEDLPAAEGARGELAALLGPRARVDVIADPAVERGGLRVKTERGEVDATLSGRWKELLAALRPAGG